MWGSFGKSHKKVANGSKSGGRADASIYRLFNVKPHFETMLWIPKFIAQNGHFVREIESFFMKKSSVFVVGFCRNMQFFVAIGSLSIFLDYVITDFDNVTTEF